MTNSRLFCALATCFAVASAAQADSLIAINFLRNPTTTPAANDGSEYGILTWVDTDASAGSTVVDGVSVSWGSTGTWSGGGNNVENGYLDNLTDITVSGLSSWLATNGATGYTVQLVQASDTASNWFGNSLISDTSGGTLLDTLTNSNLQRGATSTSILLSSDTLFIDPTTGGTRPVGGNAARTNVAGLIISVPNPFDSALRMTIDRDTGDATLTNNTGVDVNIAGIGYLSGFGSWNSSAWASITTTYDNGAVSNDEWLELSRSPYDLSESTLGSGTLSQGQTISLGNSLWKQYPDEGQIELEYLDADTEQTIIGLVEFIDSDPGNGTGEFRFGDFNFDGVINSLDWPTVRDNYNANLVGLSVTQSYQLGDINGDGLNNLSDLLQFKSIFEAANGANSFAALTAGDAVPEPSAFALLLIAGVAAGGRRFARSSRRLAALALLAVLGLFTTSVSAQDSISINFQGNRGDVVVGPAGITGSSNWNNFAGNVGTAADNLPELIDQDGAATGAGVTWASATVWGSGPNATENEKLLGGFLDDNGPEGMNVQVAGIPAASYDVTVFFNWDSAAANGVVGVFDITVNGVDFSTTGPATIPQTGVIDNGNSITVTGLSGTLNLDSGQRTNPGVSNITGLEITASSFLSAAETAMTLEVDASNGKVRIRNTSLLGAPIAFDFFEITSATNALNAVSWSPLGSGTNDGSDWEALGNLDDSNLAQFYLDGQTTLGAGMTASLGAAYKTGVGQQALEFRYHDAGSGLTRTGNVVFTTIAGLEGDFNNDGAVDAADYTVWRDNLGGSAAALNGNGSGNPTVVQADYTLWKSNFGASAAVGGLQAEAVPESSSLAIVLALCGGLALLITGRKNGVGPMFSKKPVLAGFRACLALACVGMVLGGTALAAVTNDREFLLGEGVSAGTGIGNVNENGVAGQIVGGAVSATAGTPPADLDSVDNAGPSGAYLGLTQQGDPIYANVNSGPFARPGAAVGDVGVRFDGTDDVLFGVRLNRPDELSSQPCCGSYPLNYSGITARGLQMWVYPDSAALGNGRQGIVQDTTAAGGVSISAEGNWTQTNAGHIGADVGEANVPVVGNKWNHVMQHIYPLAATDEFKSVVYVDGIAVAANDDFIGLGSAPSGFGLLVGAEDIGTGDPHVSEYANHFQGVVDNLEMYVFGTNSFGFNFGTFNLMTDNEWIASKLITDHPGVIGTPTPGDVDLDGDVDDQDVTAFIAGWRMEKSFQGAHGVTTAGDYETWQWGDTNLDGVVNFSDWALLRNNYQGSQSLNLAALLAGRGAPVPEPCSVVLLSMAIGGCLLAVRRRD